MKYIKKILKNPWTLGIGTTLIGGILLSLITDRIKGVNWLSTMTYAVQIVVNAIIAFMNFEVKVWHIVSVILVLFVILSLFVKVLQDKEKNSRISFLDYTTDFYSGFSWKWTYSKNWEGKYEITDLHPICSKCGMALKQDGAWGDQMKCLRCNTTRPWKSMYLEDARIAHQ